MKRGINSIMPVDFDIDLDSVERIEFIFSQNSAVKEFTYPSATAYRTEGENTVNLVWTQDDTFAFKAAKFAMDTRITLTGSDQQPETPIVIMEMLPTLFREVVK